MPALPQPSPWKSMLAQLKAVQGLMDANDDSPEGGSPETRAELAEIMKGTGASFIRWGEHIERVDRKAAE